jgi:sec-independent protein translocase protein TatA
MSYIAPTLALITFGIWEMLLVFGILMLLFGAKKLPMLARGLGAGVRNFKGELGAPPESETQETREEEEEEKV